MLTKIDRTFPTRKTKVSLPCQLDNEKTSHIGSDSDTKSSLRNTTETTKNAITKSLRKFHNKKNKKYTRHRSKSENRANKALRTISIILGCFVLCWTPYHVIAIVVSWCPDDCVDKHLFLLSYFICYANSPLNPFCYAFANQQFKKTFVRILNGDFHIT